ncbi:MAG: DUF1524 domain-containing protein [Actinomycetota bacterium]
MKWRVAVASVATAVAFVGVVATVDARPADLVASPNDTLSALDVLNTIRVERENTRGYSRSLFKHWLDVDGDGCDAREQVLKRDAIGLPQVDPFRCFVVEADWISAYDGKKTSDRTEVDIDHVVALKEAWDSGAFGWNEAQRTAFANDTSDPRTLLAVSSSSNRSKSDKDPSNWLPSLRGYWCTYISNWISVKARWNLSMDQSEFGRLNNLLTGQCAGTTMRGWNAPPGGVTVSTTSSTSTTSTTTATSTTRVVTVTTIASTQGGSSGSSSGSGDTSLAPIKGNPGSFCSPEGALGLYNSLVYVCSKTDAKGNVYAGNRARWRRQT